MSDIISYDEHSKTATEDESVGVIIYCDEQSNPSIGNHDVCRRRQACGTDLKNFVGMDADTSYRDVFMRFLRTVPCDCKGAPDNSHKGAPD